MLHLRVLRQSSRRAGQHAFSDLQHGREIGDFQRELDRLLGKQDGRALPGAAGRRSRTWIPPRPAQGPATARPASAVSDRSSARGRPRASAARRRTWCRRAGCGAPSAAGKFHRRDRAAPTVRDLSFSGVAPSNRLFSTLCCTNSRQPSGDSASPLRTMANAFSPPISSPRNLIEPE